jgi:hypothetical protein
LSFTRFKNRPKIAALLEQLTRVKSFKASGNQMLSHFCFTHPKLTLLVLDTKKLQSIAVERKKFKALANQKHHA